MQGNNNVGNDLKAVAQDVMQLGARCVQAGREWLTDRRSEMNNRNDENHHAHREPGRSRYQWEREQPENQRHGLGGGAYTPGSYGFGGYPGRQQGEGYGSSSGYGDPDADSYIDRSGYRAQPYVVPGDTQPRYGGPGRQRSYAGVGPRNYSRSDERITEDLCERLTHDPDIDASDIEVQVAGGTATLEGTVGQRWMKHRAEDLADGCSGVRNVENRIRVQSAQPGYDSGEYAGADWSRSTSRGSTSSASASQAGRGSTTTGTSSTAPSAGSAAATGKTGKAGSNPPGSSTPH
ncbi:BON domain-containing protein [Lysobacter sp. F60174L2]|uniref:BON domain-containing protein n=1 Tax=Lysobacter sp. F60174L2 TaxID=3459295 RepID=UPI00403D5B4D